MSYTKIKRIVMALTFFILFSSISFFEIKSPSLVANASSNGVSQSKNYDSYIYKYRNERKPMVEIKVDATKGYTFSASEDDVRVDTFEERDGILLPEEGTISYTINVLAEGLYNLKISYLAIYQYQDKIISRSASIDKGILIDGTLPFSEASNFVLPRLWEDSFSVTSNRTDKNDIKPSQIEKPIWQERLIFDENGYYGDPYFFYLTEGEHTISFVANREPVVFESFTFCQGYNITSYEEVYEDYQTKNLIKYDAQTITIQGEEASFKTSPTLAPVEDNSSALLVPYRRFKVSYNTIGGYNWRVVGDAISWTVPEETKEGLYQLTFKVLQNFSRGMFTSRKLLINGQVPFSEVNVVEFPYDNDWQNITIGNKNSPFWFHLKANDVITLEATSGRYSDLIREIDQLIYDFNLLYREIVMITGVAPVSTLDYLLARRIDNLFERIDEAKLSLERVIKGVEDIAGRGERIGPLERMLVSLKRFAKGEHEIVRGLSSFKENISSLGTWTTTIKEQPLSIDQFYLHAKDTKLPKAHSNFFQKIWHEIILFFGSFFIDQSLSSGVTGTGKTITVWISSGRDQANVVRQLIDQTFTPTYNINVDLKLVNGGVLLPATISGNGPDVAMGVGQDTPVNWGVRNAMYDLTKFSDFDQVASQFYDSALLPLSYGNAVYGLPEQQNFLVMFYRTDILEQIGITQLPKTWDEVISLIPTLQQRNLEFYLPNVAGGLNPILYALIKQNGGSLYTNDFKESALMEEKARDAFIKFTKFYADYKFVQNASFINRFRTGEMPIGISYYTEYNTLSVFAPEIRGLWDFAPLPGTIKDNILDNSTVSNVSSSVILAKSKNPNDSWEYLKWWTSKDTQVRFGRELEAIMGAAARYPTANIDALAELPWPTKDYKVLSEQMKKSHGVPVIVGSYIVGRYIDNAFRAVINNGANPNDSIYINVLKINKEITRKRQEFGLD